MLGTYSIMDKAPSNFSYDLEKSKENFLVPVISLVNYTGNPFPILAEWKRFLDIQVVAVRNAM